MKRPVGYPLRLIERVASVQDRDSHLPMGRGGGTSGGVTDDWKDSVNTQLKTLHDDVRRLTGWIITGIAVPLLAIIGLYVYSGNRADMLAQRISAIEIEQAKQAAKLDVILERTKPQR